MRPLQLRFPPVTRRPLALSTRPMHLVLVLCLAVLPLGLLGSCSSSGTISPELPTGVSVAKALGDGERDFQAGRNEDALTRVAAILREAGLSLEERAAADRLGKIVVDTLLSAPAIEGLEADELEQIARLDLPLSLRSRLAVATGRTHLQEGSRILAYRYLRDFEELFPGHPERAAAGEVLAQAGFSLIEDNGRYGFFLRYQSKGLSALELLVLRFPYDENCAEAYEALANAYEGRGDLDRAIERLEDLLLYHQDSKRAPLAEAHLPRLRMQRVTRDDFDRSELERARTELEDWLFRFRDLQGIPEELVSEVQGDLTVCLVRLANNDLVVARYHRRIKQPFGTRQHAQRVISLAGLAGEEGIAAIEEAQRLIDWADKQDIQIAEAARIEAADSPADSGTAADGTSLSEPLAEPLSEPLSGPQSSSPTGE